MKEMIRFWLAPVLLLVGGALLAAVVDSDDAVDVPIRFYEYKNGFGAGGYDVVAFFEESAAVPGTRDIDAHFGGEVWLFANEENRDTFLQAPLKYIPQYGGHCAFAVSRSYPYYGDPRAWTVRDGKLYFNANKRVRTSWLALVNGGGDGFIARSDENWRRFVTTGSFDN